MPRFRNDAEVHSYIRDCLGTPAKNIDELAERFAKRCEAEQGEYWKPGTWWLNKHLDIINQADDVLPTIVNDRKEGL